MKKNQKKNLQPETQTPDSGRSMVEMLGTLAVIGVLSITGIMGYKYAMNRYRVNQIANELNMLSNQIFLTMSLPHTGEYELSLGGGYDEGSITTAPYAFDFGCGNDMTVETPCTDSEPDYFLSLEAVPTEIRVPLVQMMEQVPSVTSVTENEELLAFVFTRDEVGIEGSSGTLVSSNGELLSGTSLPLTTTTITTSTLTKENESTITTQMIVTVPQVTITVPPADCIGTECECMSNEDCSEYGENFYCHTTATCISGKENITKSYCKKVEISDMITVSFNDNTNMPVVRAEGLLNWWTAQRYCQVLGKIGEVKQGVLVSFNDYNCNVVKSSSGHDVCYDKNTGEIPGLLQEIGYYPGHWWTSTISETCGAYNTGWSTYESKSRIIFGTSDMADNNMVYCR